MKKSSTSALQLTFFLLFPVFWAASADAHQDFLGCLMHESNDPVAFSKVISAPHNNSYSSILNVSIQNLRFTQPSTRKPQLIITPDHESQIQTAIYCSKKHNMQVRILSGGHDFEGSSYVSDVPFFVLNMFNFRSVMVDAKSRTAWVGAGATLGETYYNIVKVNRSLAFSAGYHHTVCIGGHVSGGGYGPLIRKFGLAADNVLDARVIDARGRILNRKSMGEDLFWAIRGGTGASFAVILEYKIRLVEVSNHLTAFRLQRTPEQNATELVHKWQYVAPRLPEDLLLELQLTVFQSSETGKRTVQASFVALFEGGADELLGIMIKHFPELGVAKEDCVQLSSWVEFITYFYHLPIEDTYKLLQSRVPLSPKSYFKSKADFVQKPIPKSGLKKLWNLLLKIDSPPVQMNWTPYGARMTEIPSSEIPFPHRAGNIFMVFKKIQWHDTNPEVMEERFASMRNLHSLMGEFVDNNPRGAYADYRDLDLGVNNVNGKTSVERARIWGAPYFKNNFDRLVKVKTMVDPDDYFKNEQSIPPISSHASLLNQLISSQS